MFGFHAGKVKWDFAGLVLDYDKETEMVTMEQRNYFKPGDTVEFFGPDIETFQMTVGQIWDEDGNELDVARHPLQILKFKVDRPLTKLNMMRKEND